MDERDTARRDRRRFWLREAMTHLAFARDASPVERALHINEARNCRRQAPRAVQQDKKEKP